MCELNPLDHSGNGQLQWRRQSQGGSQKRMGPGLEMKSSRGKQDGISVSRCLGALHHLQLIQPLLLPQAQRGMTHLASAATTSARF